jgi:tRNA (guanine-N7-)-methyltransferase
VRSEDWAGARPEAHGPERPWRNLYGRRRGKRLRPAQERSLTETLPRVRIAGVDPAENPDRRLLAAAAPFGDARPLWLEIGFGGGEHLAAQARLHSGVGFLGCEVFVNGVAMLLGKIERESIGNIRVHPGDARDLLDVLPPGSVGRVFLLYPDPWPKARHQRRRFVRRENLMPLARVMTPGAELRLATDVRDYAEHARDAVAAVPELAPVVTAAPDWRVPWADWQPTRYETKAVAAGRVPHYLTWRRR